MPGLPISSNIEAWQVGVAEKTSVRLVGINFPQCGDRAAYQYGEKDGETCWRKRMLLLWLGMP